MFDENTIITQSNPKSPISEAYRVLRTNIQYSSVDKQLKTVVITSSGPMEGKTTTIVNLAVTFAQSGSKVLIIDCDLRKPVIHKLFLLPNKNGLTNFLAVHDDYKKYIRKSDIQNLDLLLCGTIPPNPSEILSSNSMKQFIKKMSEEYDMVFLDAPPVGNVTDAAIISTYTDGTILVANSGKVQIDDLKRARELLGKVNANILGVVLNNLDKNAKGNYYYYQYNYAGDEEQGKKKKKVNKKKGKFPEPKDE